MYNNQYNQMRDTNQMIQVLHARQMDRQSVKSPNMRKGIPAERYAVVIYACSQGHIISVLEHAGENYTPSCNCGSPTHFERAYLADKYGTILE